MPGALSILSFIVFGAGLLLLAAWLAGSVAVSWRTQPRIAAAQPPAEDFDLATPDGLSLRATYWPGRTPDAPGVIVQHGVYDSRQDVAANAAWLAAQGFAVLTFDFRGHGQSGAAPHSFGLFESIDARTALDWLKRRQNGASVGVIGISLGGAACLLGADGPLDADALALQAVYPDIRRAIRNRIEVFLPGLGPTLEPLLSLQSHWRFGVGPDRISPVTQLASYRRPVLVIGGQKDRFTPPEETREIFATAADARDLLLVDGLNHPQTAALQSDEYRQTIRQFFCSTLGAP